MGLRQELHQLCSQHVSTRIKDIQAAIAQVHEAAANETKSSAGDKYETAREMLQQEMNINQANINQLLQVKAVLDSIATIPVSDTIALGSVVHTNRGNYYVAAGAGTFTCNGNKYHTISTSSPIGKHMIGLKQGATFTFNGLEYLITDLL